MTVGAADFEMRTLHRLALGVEPIDAHTKAPIGQRVRVGREVGRVALRIGTARPLDPSARRTDLPFESVGTSKFKLRHGPGVGANVVVRLADPTRGFIPRRFDVPLWTLAEIEQPTGPFVAARSRLLRPFLLPGTAYPVPASTTGLRGRIARGDQPVPWPRVAATLPSGQVVGRAHGDERGEFLLLLSGLVLGGDQPAAVDVQLVMHGPAAGAGVPPDPPLERVTRSSAPPLPTDLDNPLLRGEAIPAGYVQSSAAPIVTVALGAIRPVPTPFVFWP